ncbi:M23 family metallopeptidase [Epibacterium sp. MM17-32]|uniref:peptidoglycan DD-metalloendopeptidase family protein n=1 Tax=Epibacterium sp. MM17-32 TaxID=2917734 RepID=UPI001EF70E48|nr:M23 family metallopeptidase [Epibacterium sp. MM17-32]
MNFTIDPAFQRSTAQARKRRRRRLLLRGLGAGVALAALATVGVWLWGRQDARGAGELAMVPTEVPDPSATETRSRAMLNLRRAPMLLHLEAGAARGVRQVPLPAGGLPGRAAAGQEAQVTVVQDSLLAPGRNLVLQLPSGRDDFALFQAQRRRALDQATSAAAQGRGGLSQARDSSVALARRADRRAPLAEEKIIVLNAEQPLQEVLVDSGFAAGQAARVAAAAVREVGAPEAALPAGSVVALRWRSRPEAAAQRQLLQMSLYGPERYLASLAQTGPGRFARAADPWAEQDLLGRSARAASPEPAGRSVRLMDALYSTALRNGVATGVAGELIVMMSRQFDLERLAERDDQAVVLLAPGGGAGAGGRAGQILYVGIEGPAGQMRCYVIPLPGPDGGFGCYDGAAGTSAAAGGVRLGAGLVIPVTGVKTSGFSMRMHPIRNKMLPHNGVDWAAPEGTPVYAARAGKIRLAGDSGSYGTLVAIDHGDGLETRYAHLQRLADGMAPGMQVAAGDQIGFVGSTGRSTGPHLHFELWVDGRPTDPARFGSTAVAALVDRIIQVESGGRADAQNPLSSATGAGQFIASTWMRMMQSYRPDLVAEMSREELLALRLDPRLSREMVERLAQEGEAYLRARGHQVTAGRLYLAHFLGAEGAHRALASDPEQSVEEVLGAQVVSANPFLTGKRIADLLAWADRKMRHKGRQRTAPVPPEIRTYMAKVDAMLAAL